MERPFARSTGIDAITCRSSMFPHEIAYGADGDQFDHRVLLDLDVIPRFEAEHEIDVSEGVPLRDRSILEIVRHLIRRDLQRLRDQVTDVVRVRHLSLTLRNGRQDQYRNSS